MTVYLVKKEKNRIYKSEQIIKDLFGKRLTHDEDGAPLLIGDSEEILLNEHVSVSDTKNYWACAFSDDPVGVDMEELSRKSAPAVVKRFHPAEREYLSVLCEGSSEWKDEFLTIWTRKEAYSKYKGKGLALGFSRFCVLEDSLLSLDTKLYTKKACGLIISATEEFEIKKMSYDAPHTKTALEAGADILDVIGCSAGTLKTKLINRGYSEEEAQDAVDKLTDRGFLNDREYARGLAEKYAAKGYSSRRIEAELKQRLIDPETARNASLTYKSFEMNADDPDGLGGDPEDDRMRAERVARKTLGSSSLDDKTKAKIARKLASLGYDTYIIYDTINKLN